MGSADYAGYLISRRLSGKTITRYVRWVRDAEEWFERRGLTLETATPTDIARWAEMRVTYSHSCRGQAAAALKHYWQWKQRRDAPTSIVVPPSPQYECRAITESQARDVVKMSIGWWPEGTVVLAGMYLALRRFEIAKMEWSRFDDEMAWYTVTGKNSKTATLPVHPILASELEPRRGTDRWVFPGRFPGRHISEATVWDWTRRVGQAVGIPNLEPHELRHTALAHANDELGDLRAVQTFARHTDPSTTAIYTRTRKKRLREVSDSLDYV